MSPLVPARPIRVAIYARVSTGEQSTDAQVTELREWCARQGHTVAHVVTETGSGARNDRPGWREVMDAAARRRVDLVAVWKLDRASRSVSDLLAQLEKLRELGCGFTAVTQGITFGTDATSTLLLHVLAAVAEFERELIRERTRAGLRKAKAAGKRPGRRSVITSADVRAARELLARELRTESGHVVRRYTITSAAKVLKLSERSLRRALLAEGEAGEKGPPEAPSEERGIPDPPGWDRRPGENDR